MKTWLACALVVAASGCPDIKTDPNEVGGGPMVEFDPAKSLATKARYIPFPNDLVRDPATGKIALPPQACESTTSKQTREQILNKLDGFGTYETAMQVTFTADVDPATLVAAGGADDTVVMYQRTNGGTQLDPASATKIPIVVIPGHTLRQLDGKCTEPDTVSSITIVPRVPLKQKSTYVVALEKGIKAASGDDFAASYTWDLVNSKDDPVTVDDRGNVISDRTPLDPADPDQLAQLIALDGMWKLHAPSLAFLDAVPNARTRADTLVAFQFTTQTTADPLDPMVAGSPAASLSTSGFIAGPGSVTATTFPSTATALCSGSDNATQCFLKLALGGCSPKTTGCTSTNYNTGVGLCNALGCANIGDVLGGGVLTTIYQTPQTNPLAGGSSIPGPWSDPVNPAMQSGYPLQVLVVVPTGTMPAAGWPTIVFGHGLGSSKEALFAIAASFARAGFASVAIDFQGHGSRATRVSKDPALGCIGSCFDNTGTMYAKACDTVMDCNDPANDTCGQAGNPVGMPPSPTEALQCYAPFLSPDLATTRDGIRQTVLDLHRLMNALKTCGTAPCNGFQVDTSKIQYTGQSLGSIIGTTFVGTSPGIKGGVLNVGAVGWADVLENTQNLTIRCSLVNGLIDAGILTGDKWTGGTTGLCTTDAWKLQPGYQTFAAIGRWVLDPADPANFASKTATKRFLIQEVVDDQVVPNVATDRQGALVGLGGMDQVGDMYLPPGNTGPSAALANPLKNLWVKYPTLPPDGATSFPGNTFEHPSLLRPSSGIAGQLGTARLQTDAIFFLGANK